MKHITILMLLLAIIGQIGAVDTESYQFIDHLLALSGPGEPVIYEDGVVFTAPSSYRRVGIAFAHEGFSTIHWFKKLMVPGDVPSFDGMDTSKLKDDFFYRDSGVLFHVYTVPEGVEELEYRLIIDGLWSRDPLNPAYRLDRNSGIVHSVVRVPKAEKPHSNSGVLKGEIRFVYDAPPGELITVGGNFNRWDPFMYELEEQSPGRYTLTLPLPPGTYHYVFFHRGERILDPANRNKVYTPEGKVASEVRVE